MRVRIAQVLSAVVGVGAVSCSAEVRERKLRRGMTDDICVDGELRLLEDVNATRPYEYLARRSVHDPASILAQFELIDDLIDERERALLIEDELEREEALADIDHTFSFYVSVIDETGTCIGAGCGPLPLPEEDGQYNGYTWHHVFSSLGEVAKLHVTDEEILAFLGPSIRLPKLLCW